jgi:VanZ family protein
MIRNILYWLPTLAFMALIFYLSSIPGQDLEPPVSDIMLHLAVYFILALLVLFSLSKGLFRSVPGRIYLLAFFITVVYGLSDEWHQAFTPGRHPSLKDLFVDGAAALLAMGFHFAVTRIRRF